MLIMVCENSIELNCFGYVVCMYVCYGNLSFDSGPTNTLQSEAR